MPRIILHPEIEAAARVGRAYVAYDRAVSAISAGAVMCIVSNPLLEARDRARVELHDARVAYLAISEQRDQGAVP